MKKLLLASTVLLATTMASHATVVNNLGINPTSSTGDFSSGVLGINGTGAGLFADQFLFNLVGGPQFVTIASATNVYPGGPASTDFISNFAAAVLNFGLNGIFEPGGTGDDAILLGPALATAGCGIIANCQGMAGIAQLNAGSYYLELTGTGGGSSGYGGNIATLAVPGPIAGAGLPGLITACLGLWGLAMKRRRRNGSVA